MSLNIYDKNSKQKILVDGTDEVDNALSTTSTNPVENKVITEEINSISSEISDMNNVLGAKNLLPNNAVTQTVNGVTFTINSDGSISVTGRASSSAILHFSELHLPAGTYTLSGIPKETDTTGKYYAEITYSDGTELSTPVRDRGKSTELATFSLASAADVRAYLSIVAGETVNFLYQPMIRPASITDDTYVPYAKTNRELTEQITNIGTILEANGSVHPTESSGYFDICSLTLPKGTWIVTCWSYITWNGNQTYNNALFYNGLNYVVRTFTANGGGNIMMRCIKAESPIVVTAKGFGTPEFVADSARKQSSEIQAIRIA